MADTQAYMWLGVRYPQLSRGFHWLTRLRLGSFWTAKRLARIGWLVDEFRTKCPFCGLVGTCEDEARRAHSEWARDEGPIQGGPKWERYLRFRSKAHRLKSRSAKVSWLRHVTMGAQKVCDNDLGGFWRWANQIMHRGKSGPADLGPMYTEGDTLVYDPREKLQAWHRHYEKLLGDPTGHSRDQEYWAQKLPGPVAAELPGLNGRIEWHELNRALGKLKGGKAPGRDGVPPEFYKLATETNISANKKAYVKRLPYNTLRL
jgi:hypothetical protein